MLKLGSLFDGSGGFPLGASLVGMNPVWCSEIEPFPIRVTMARFPEMKHYGDVSQINGSEIEPVDVITFGSPCQDLSLAGKRNGLQGSRSSLFHQAIRIIKEMREATNGLYPRIIVWENVYGAFSSTKGQDFRKVLEEICKVADPEVSIPFPGKWMHAGSIVGDTYSVAWRLFDAQYWGVPQRRRRIYLVADFGGKCAGEVLFKSEGLSGYTSGSRKTWKGVAFRTKTGFADTNEQIMLSVENHPTDGRVKVLADGKVQTLTSRMGTGGNNVPILLKIRGGIEGGGERTADSRK